MWLEGVKKTKEDVIVYNLNSCRQVRTAGQDNYVLHEPALQYVKEVTQSNCTDGAVKI
jgi:hypothetical protein